MLIIRCIHDGLPNVFSVVHNQPSFRSVRSSVHLMRLMRDACHTLHSIQLRLKGVQIEFMHIQHLIHLDGREVTFLWQKLARTLKQRDPFGSVQARIRLPLRNTNFFVMQLNYTFIIMKLPAPKISSTFRGCSYWSLKLTILLLTASLNIRSANYTYWDIYTSTS